MPRPPLIERSIATFDPIAVLFVGIAGGLLPNIKLGDVVVATRVYALYGGRDEPGGFLVRPRSWEASHQLLQLAVQVARSGPWIGPLPGSVVAPESPAVHFAAIAAGEVVLSSGGSALAQRLLDHYNDAAALGIEDAAFAQAAHMNRTVQALVIRGISDTILGDLKGADSQRWRQVAATHAASFAIALADNLARESATGHVADTVARPKPTPGTRVSVRSATGRGDVAERLVSATRGEWAMQRPEPGLVVRPELAEPLVALLTHPKPTTVGVSTALYGAGGFGKTTLARQVCADPRVRARFRGGGAWVSVGEKVTDAQLAEKINAVHYQLSGDKVDLADPEQAGIRLGVLLDRCQDVLLVIDDVWTVDQLRPFLHGGANTCARLVTTRRPNILPRVVLARSVRVDQLSQEQARGLLVVDVPSLDGLDLAELLKLTGRWPLLVQLASRRLAVDIGHGYPPSEVLARLVRRLRDDGPATLDLRDQDSRDHAAGASIAASMDLLSSAERARLVELGIFAEDVDIPRDVLGLLWQSTGGLTLVEIDRLCELLDSLSLVADYSPEGLRLHDVIRAYLRQQGLDQLARTNAMLVQAASRLIPTKSTDRDPQTGAAWWLLPTESGYLWQHLCRHLFDAAQQDALATLTTDLRWIEAKLRRSGPAAVDADLALTDHSTAQALRRALGQNAHLLGPTYPDHALADILVSRLYGMPGLQGALDAYVATLPRERRLTPRAPLPDQPHPSLRRVLVGHTDQAISCAVDPSGCYLATTSDDGTVRIWDTDTGIVRHVLAGHTASVVACAIDSNGAWLITTSVDGTARVWDPATGTLRHVLTGHTSAVVACAVDTSGHNVVTVSEDGTARIWDLDTGTQRYILTGHTRSVVACAVDPGGQWLATTSIDGTARIWDINTGTQRHVLSGHTRSLVACAVDPNGRYLVTTSEDGTARIWDPGTGMLCQVLTGHTGSVAAACTVGPRGQWLATASIDGTARIWDINTGTQRHILTGHTGAVVACAVDPQGQWLATTSIDVTTRIWDINTGTQRHVLTGHTKSVVACAVDPHGQWLATTSIDNTVRIWDINTSTLDHASTSHAGKVDLCVVDSHGRWVAPMGIEDVIRIWDPDTGALRHLLTGHTGSVASCAVESGGQWLATTSIDGTARIWDPDNGIQRLVLTGHTSSVTFCDFDPHGRRLVTTSHDRTARIWDARTGAKLRVLTGHTDSVVSCAVDPLERWLVTTSHDRTSIIWDLNTGNQCHTLLGHADQVDSCAIDPLGRWLVTTSHDHTARTWDPKTGAPRHVLVGHTGPLVACAVDPSGRWLVTTSEDRTARIWDSGSGRPLHVLIGHTRSVVACAVDPSGRWLVTTSIDGTARVWSATTGQCETVMRASQAINACQASRDMVVLGGDGGLYLFTFAQCGEGAG